MVSGRTRVVPVRSPVGHRTTSGAATRSRCRERDRRHDPFRPADLDERHLGRDDAARPGVDRGGVRPALGDDPEHPPHGVALWQRASGRQADLRFGRASACGDRAGCRRSASAGRLGRLGQPELGQRLDRGLGVHAVSPPPLGQGERQRRRLVQHPRQPLALGGEQGQRLVADSASGSAAGRPRCRRYSTDSSRSAARAGTGRRSAGRRRPTPARPAAPAAPAAPTRTTNTAFADRVSRLPSSRTSSRTSASRCWASSITTDGRPAGGQRAEQLLGHRQPQFLLGQPVVLGTEVEEDRLVEGRPAG